MKLRRWLAGLLAAVLLLTPTTALAAGSPALTRAEARDMLLEAADDYNPGVTAEDVMHGDETGDLREDQPVTRAEALVMLSRAFGDLPEPVGDSARWAYDAGNFTDIPTWAREELEDVWTAGIVAGTTPTTFSPDGLMTEEQLDALIHRVYALEGTNLKDDFYATVNKEWLDTSEIPAGYTGGGTLYSMEVDTNQQVSDLVQEIVRSNPAAGSKEAKIKNLYESIVDWDARNAAGVTPIQPWLDAVEQAASLDELMEVHNTITREAAVSMLLGFGLTVDTKDSNKKILAFSSLAPFLEAASSYEDELTVQAYVKLMETFSVLGGESPEQAAKDAAINLAVEKDLAGKMMELQDYYDVNNTYNLYTMEELQAMFPQVDLQAALDASGLTLNGKIQVYDPGLLEAAAAYFTADHLDELKAIMKVNILFAFSDALSKDFLDANLEYQYTIYGVEVEVPDEVIAMQRVQAYLPDYLGQIYVERYFSEQAKADVEAMIEDILGIYETRIRALDWMSEATKEKAVAKLEAITVNVGYPDEWNDTMDAVEIKGPDQGGSYFENQLAISRAFRDATVRDQNEPVDKDAWQMSAYTVNAYYDATTNSINFPAAILQAPLYDVHADETENLGGIGYVIAHEITHAFDNSGAQFDAEGNATDWWTAEDYAAFQALCDQVVAFYDGQEIIPGIVCDGALTLGENVADLGALACITQAESRNANPDYQTLYQAAARTWCGTSSREMRAYLAVTDVHGADKLRVNRALQSCDEFYEAFDIQPGDGMYVAPEDRVQIW